MFIEYFFYYFIGAVSLVSFLISFNSSSIICFCCSTSARKVIHVLFFNACTPTKATPAVVTLVEMDLLFNPTLNAA